MIEYFSEMLVILNTDFETSGSGDIEELAGSTTGSMESTNLKNANSSTTEILASGDGNNFIEGNAFDNNLKRNMRVANKISSKVNIYYEFEFQVVIEKFNQFLNLTFFESKDFSIT